MGLREDLTAGRKLSQNSRFFPRNCARISLCKTKVPLPGILALDPGSYVTVIFGTGDNYLTTNNEEAKMYETSQRTKKSRISRLVSISYDLWSYQ